MYLAHFKEKDFGSRQRLAYTLNEEGRINKTSNLRMT